MFGDDDHGYAAPEGTDGGAGRNADAALRIRKLRWLGLDEEADRLAARVPCPAASALLVPPDTD